MIEPHGGVLVDVMASPARSSELKQDALSLLSWDLLPRQLRDLELIMNGGFSPLRGFMDRADYDSVVEDMRLASGVLWPMPVVLDVTEEFAGAIKPGERIALRHPEGMLTAVMHVRDVWRADKANEAKKVFGTDDETHPGVFELTHGVRPFYVGGEIEGVEAPTPTSFADLALSPSELRERFAGLGASHVVGYHAERPLHRAEIELTKSVAGAMHAHLFVNAVTGVVASGDRDHYAAVRSFKAAISKYEAGSASLSLLPLVTRCAGPREALWQAIVNKNYGGGRFLVQRDHASAGTDSDGQSFYGPSDAFQLVEAHQQELGIQAIDAPEMVYDATDDRFVPVAAVPAGHEVQSLTADEFDALLAKGDEVPDWYSYPEIIDELRQAHPPRSRQGFTVFLTGLPSSGKSTVANILAAKLLENGSRPVTLLDGDLVRKHLSSELTFSKEHRDLNIQRIGFVAAEITKNHGAAVCAPIAPYRKVRRLVREMIGQVGGFIEVHISTPVEVCEARDRKGLYAKAKAGLIKDFTGVNDPYEVPEKPELRLDTTEISADRCADMVLEYLASEGYL